MRQYLLEVPKSIDIGFLGIKFVLISNPLKSLVPPPPPPLVKGQVAPFILVIPLKSLINALCHILVVLPNVLLLLIAKGIKFPLIVIEPLMLIELTLKSVI